MSKPEPSAEAMEAAERHFREWGLRATLNAALAQTLDAFASLAVERAVAEEREANAVACDLIVASFGSGPNRDGIPAGMCAAAIRARGDAKEAGK